MCCSYLTIIPICPTTCVNQKIHISPFSALSTLPLCSAGIKDATPRLSTPCGRLWKSTHTTFPQEPVTTICCLIKREYWFLMLSANSQHVLVSCTGSTNHAETVPLLGRFCTREPLKHCQGSKNLFLDASANWHSIRCQQEPVNTICCKISRSKWHRTGPCCFGTDPLAKTVQILGHSCTWEPFKQWPWHFHRQPRILLSNRHKKMKHDETRPNSKWVFGLIFISFDLFGFFAIFFQFLPMPSAAWDTAFSASTGPMQCRGYGSSAAAGSSHAAWELTQPLLHCLSLPPLLLSARTRKRGWLEIQRRQAAEPSDGASLAPHRTHAAPPASHWPSSSRPHQPALLRARSSLHAPPCPSPAALSSFPLPKHIAGHGFPALSEDAPMPWLSPHSNAPSASSRQWPRHVPEPKDTITKTHSTVKQSRPFRHTYLSIYRSIYLPIYLSVYLSISLSLSIYLLSIYRVWASPGIFFRFPGDFFSGNGVYIAKHTKAKAATMVGSGWFWLILVGGLVGGWVGWWVRGLVGLLACLLAWLLGWLVGRLIGWSVDWLVSWLVSRSVGRLVAWLVVSCCGCWSMVVGRW